MPAAHGVAFEVLGTTVAVETPDEETTKAVAGLLPAYVSTRRATATECWRISDREGAWSIEGHLAPPDTFTSRDDALEALEYLIVLRLLHHADRVAHVHASGAVRNGEAMLALGTSGAGKTSIAFHWSLSGLPVLSDDVVFVDHDAAALPFKRLFSVDPRRFHAAELEPDPTLQIGSAEEHLWFDPASHGRWGDRAPVGTLAFIHYDPSTKFSIEPLPTPEALSLLLASVMDSGLSPEAAIDRLANVAKRARTLRVTFNDSAVAAATLAEA